MLSLEPGKELNHGKLVAFEGDVETISTQLRLLPPSRKILVLPPLADDVVQGSESQPFNPRAFVRDVHTALTGRLESAQSFLQASTITQPRLVFMNGGSVGARAICISRICANVTHGDFKEAEKIFNEIAIGGVSGLSKIDVVADQQQSQESRCDNLQAEDKVDGIDEHPSLKAMRAAEFLDRETAELQPDVESYSEDDGTGIREDPEEILTTEVKGNTFATERGDDIVRTLVTLPLRTLSLPGTQKALGRDSLMSTSDSYSDDQRDLHLLSPGNGSILSSLPSPTVIFGEACVVDVEVTQPKKIIKSVKSADALFQRSSNEEMYLRFPKPQRPISACHITAKAAVEDITTNRNSSLMTFQGLPRTTFMRASQTVIKKTSQCAGGAESPIIPISVSSPPLDRGIDTEDTLPEVSPTSLKAECTTKDEFKVVFNMVEDLVIHLTGKPDEILDYVICSYQSGCYPILPSSSTSEFFSNSRTSSVHEFNPYKDEDSSPSNAKVNLPVQRKLGHPDSGVQNHKPPTPTTTTPPPTSNHTREKFCEFSTIDSGSAVMAQNSLRSILNLHFPAGEDGFTQHYYSSSPEMDRLWKPVFMTNDYSSMVTGSGTIDQIIALGCDEGVNNNFLAQISGQVERLGSKKDGVSRSGRLDLRYLIANAMQAHTWDAGSAPTVLDRPSNPYLLATLLIPYLEAYLAVNTTTGFLVLQFPSSHLSTVFALRHLLGSNLFRVAGIVDTLSCDPPSFSKGRTVSINAIAEDVVACTSNPCATNLQSTSPDSSEMERRRPSYESRHTPLLGGMPKKLESGASFSRANYILPNTATDVEIGTFISEIQKVLVQKSSFYTSETPEAPIVIEGSTLSPGGATKVTKPPRKTSFLSDGPRKRPESKVSRLTGGLVAGASTPRTLSNDALSISSTARTATTLSGSTTAQRGSTATQRWSTDYEKSARQRDKEWESIDISEEDSEEDGLSRMIRRVAIEKRGDSRKALKCLGLA